MDNQSTVARANAALQPWLVPQAEAGPIDQGESTQPARRAGRTGSVQNIERRSYHSFSPTSDLSISINFGYRGMLLTPSGNQAFLAVLRSNARELSQTQIKSLSDVMGVWPFVRNDPENPSANLRSATIRNAGGENYLYVEGNYENNGVPTTYMGAFIAGGRDPVSLSAKVEEVQLHGPSERIYAYRPAFETVVSIVSAAL
jgi:hypothetical protein